jgi:hypothetical protein
LDAGALGAGGLGELGVEDGADATEGGGADAVALWRVKGCGSTGAVEYEDCAGCGVDVVGVGTVV